MEYIQNFAIFLGLSWILIITPGPDLIYVLTKGISGGRKVGIISAAGVTLGIFVHTIFAAIGLSVILKTSALAFSIVKIVGGGYLIYLGLKSILSKSEFKLGKTELVSNKKIFTQGLISNTLNPKVALFFMAFLPQFIKTSGNHETAVPFILLGMVFAFCTFLFLAILGYFSGTLGQYLMKNNKITNRIQKFSGAILVLLGIKVALMKQK